jgi:hypothetical protein
MADVPKLRNGQDSSLQSKVSCVPNRKTTGGTASPLAAAEKRCQCIKHAAAQLYYPYTTSAQQQKVTKQTAEDRAFLIDKTSAA